MGKYFNERMKNRNFKTGLKVKIADDPRRQFNAQSRASGQEQNISQDTTVRQDNNGERPALPGTTDSDSGKKPVLSRRPRIGRVSARHTGEEGVQQGTDRQNDGTRRRRRRISQEGKPRKARNSAKISGATRADETGGRQVGVQETTGNSVVSE